MPLNTLPSRGPTGVDRYLHSREPGAIRPESRSLTPQPRRERSKQRANGAATRGARPNSSNGHASHTPKFNRQDFAQSMKLPVPDTLAKAKARPTHSLHQDLSTTKPVPIVSQFQLPAESKLNAFDDTQSIHFDDSTSFADGPENQRNATFGGFNNPQDEQPSSNPFGREKQHFKAQRFTQPQGPNWQKQIDGRIRPGELPKYGNTHDRGPQPSVPPSEEAYDDGYEPDGEYADNDPNTWDTPSRARMPPPENEPTKSKPQPPDMEERSRSPHLHHHRDQQQQHKSRFQVHKQTVVDNNAPEGSATIDQHPPPHAAAQARQDIQPAAPPFSSKISSYHESSSEEEEEEMARPTVRAPSSPLPPSTTTNNKRPRTEEALDFSPADITAKTMADVDAVPFTTDPSCPPPVEPALDSHGTPMSLAARLTNLTKMRHEDQRHLFRSLTDAEREQTAAWFLERFRVDVQRLMDVRFERRRTALKYELEVKKRDARVEAKQQDVDEELAGLRKGGGALIAGKGAAAAAAVGRTG